MFLYTKQKQEILSQIKNKKQKLIIKNKKYLINKTLKNLLEFNDFFSLILFFFSSITSPCDKDQNLIILSITNEIIFEYTI